MLIPSCSEQRVSPLKVHCCQAWFHTITAVADRRKGCLAFSTRPRWHSNLSCGSERNHFFYGRSAACYGSVTELLQRVRTLGLAGWLCCSVILSALQSLSGKSAAFSPPHTVSHMPTEAPGESWILGIQAL